MYAIFTTQMTYTTMGYVKPEVIGKFVSAADFLNNIHEPTGKPITNLTYVN